MKNHSSEISRSELLNSELLKSELLKSELFDSGVLRLTLNDQRRRNALSEDMLAQLMDVLATAATHTEVRVIVLAAEGPAFCAGHDLNATTMYQVNAKRFSKRFSHRRPRRHRQQRGCSSGT